MEYGCSISPGRVAAGCGSPVAAGWLRCARTLLDGHVVELSALLADMACPDPDPDRLTRLVLTGLTAAGLAPHHAPEPTA